jgi:predicted nucleic acid-binding protein
VSGVVLDCSAALALVLPDESSEAVHSVLQEASERGDRIIVPALWWYECTMALLETIRQERLDAATAREALALLARLPSSSQEGSSLANAIHYFHLGVRFSLTAYDAAYLALAESTGGSLLTLDGSLREAAGALEIPLVP